ncbi:MAG: GntR family transcriptional regulator [Proteobacteria bacterium]|nr:GntR family transcriptional regulator [Pseudomonadota bacterium]
MGSQPLYRQIKEQLVASLARNEWRPGEMIPTEPQLAARFGVGISTIRAAIGELVAGNVLVRTQGKGTYVARHNAPGNVYRFFNVVRNGGAKDSFHRELLSLRRERAAPSVAAQLQFPPGLRSPQVFRMRIRLSAADANLAYAEILVPTQLFTGLDARTVADGPASLYALYQSRFGVNIVRVTEKLLAVSAGATVARILGVTAATPMLKIERTAFTFNRVPVELRTTYVHTQHYHYLVSQGAEG